MMLIYALVIFSVFQLQWLAHITETQAHKETSNYILQSAKTTDSWHSQWFQTPIVSDADSSKYICV